MMKFFSYLDANIFLALWISWASKVKSEKRPQVCLNNANGFHVSGQLPLLFHPLISLFHARVLSEF